MPVNIIDISAFTDPATSPTDGDAGNGANFLAAFQKVANRTRFLKNQIDPLLGFAMFDISGSPAASAKCTLVEAIDPNSQYSVASDEITFPSVGVYEVSVFAGVTSANATNPLELALAIVVGAVAIGLQETRYSATTSIVLKMACTVLFNVTSVADKLTLINNSGVAIVLQTASARLTIRRLS